MFEGRLQLLLGGGGGVILMRFNIQVAENDGNDKKYGEPKPHAMQQ